VAVIVNDMSEVNIDANLIRDGGADLSRTDEQLVEMTNGCICCTLREDLLEEVQTLATEDRFDHLLIESTGISEPLPVASTFEFRDEHGKSLSDLTNLDSMVTVVDAASLLLNYASHDFLKDRGEFAGDEDDRTLVDLLVDQIEFADTIILNKVSDAGPEQLEAARLIIRALNPEAVLFETDYSRIALTEVLGTGRFDFEKAHEHPLWYKELNGFSDHVPETEEYGIRSFVYNARRPFDPAKFQAFIGRNWPGVVRAKGFFWLATRPRYVGEVSMAGAIVKTEKRGVWWSAAPQSMWPDNPEWKKSMEPYFDATWGDRRQEIVFIGTEPMDEEKIRNDLDACLVSAPAFLPKLGENMFDPFPAWENQGA